MGDGGCLSYWQKTFTGLVSHRAGRGGCRGSSVACCVRRIGGRPRASSGHSAWTAALMGRTRSLRARPEGCGRGGVGVRRWMPPIPRTTTRSAPVIRHAESVRITSDPPRSASYGTAVRIFFSVVPRPDPARPPRGGFLVASTARRSSLRTMRRSEDRRCLLRAAVPSEGVRRADRHADDPAPGSIPRGAPFRTS